MDAEEFETKMLFHGTAAAADILRDGFRLDAKISKYGMPWVSTWRGGRSLAAGNGDVIVIDPSNLLIMPASEAIEGPEDPSAFARWVKNAGYDAFEHPQEDGEVGIVNLDKIRIIPKINATSEAV